MILAENISHLPAFAIAEELNRRLAAATALVVTAPPGAGKSTVLPLTMLEALPEGAGKIIMLEPRRIAAVAAWHPELDLPDVSTDALLQRAGEWLPAYIGKASSTAQLRKLEMDVVIWGLLSYDQQQAVDRIAPMHIVVPTGSRIRLEYRQGAEAPVLRVRLQESFGLLDTPHVDGGKRPVLMELLSPGYKPVQLTSDLHSFWSGAYFEIRKELLRRYPKHAWLEDPLSADPVRGVKRE